jgi:hypothetical protein
MYINVHSVTVMARSRRFVKFSSNGIISGKFGFLISKILSRYILTCFDSIQRNALQKNAHTFSCKTSVIGRSPKTGMCEQMFAELAELNSVALVRKRTIPTERLPLVGKVSANFCG